MFSGKAKWVVFLLFVIASAMLGAYFWLLVMYPAKPVSAEGDKVVLELSANEDAYSLSKKLKDAKLIRHPMLWVAYMRLLGADERLREGEIQFKLGMTPEEIARYSARGLGAIDVWVTVPEGFTRYDIAARLEQRGVVDADEFFGCHK